MNTLYFCAFIHFALHMQSLHMLGGGGGGDIMWNNNNNMMWQANNNNNNNMPYQLQQQFPVIPGW